MKLVRADANFRAETKLRLDETRIQAMADGIRQMAALEDPVGRLIAGNARTPALTP